METSLSKHHTEMITRKWLVIENLSNEYAKTAGLTPMGLHVLATIYTNTTYCTQKMICEQTHYNKQSVNMIIRSFWEKGMIELVELAADRRNKHISLTTSGTHFATQVLTLLRQIEFNALAKLSTTQKESLVIFLEAYELCFNEGIATLKNTMHSSPFIAD